jgi:cytochrome c-type biogenesis protein CcmH/NrfG
MSRDGVIFGIAGACFGIVLGWILGSQQVARSAPPPVAAAASSQPQAAGNEPPAPQLDEQRVAVLERDAKARPTDFAVRVELANLYYDARRFDRAVPWYEEAHRLNPKDVNVSTDLAVGYYLLDQPDKALVQIQKSLAVDPGHLKTLLNQGIIRAFGKQDLAGAQESWEKVVKLAPTSAEAARAQQGLDGLRSGHSAAPAATPGARGGRGGGN